MKKKNDNMEINEMLKFVQAAICATSNDYEAEFECPLCKGVAYAVKAKINEHIHAHCPNCDAGFMQ